MTSELPLFDQHNHRDDQASRILEYLRAGNKLTPMDALQMFGCFRLGARAFDLKRQGHPIVSEMVKLPNGKRVAQYRYES